MAKGDAKITVEVTAWGVDLAQLDDLVGWIADDLPGHIHQRVTANPGIDAAVLRVEWTTQIAPNS